MRYLIFITLFLFISCNSLEPLKHDCLRYIKCDEYEEYESIRLSEKQERVYVMPDIKDAQSSYVLWVNKSGKTVKLLKAKVPFKTY